MKKMGKQILLSVIGNFLGILLASILLKDLHISPLGIFVSVLIFTASQILLAPIVSKLTKKYAPSLASLIALITTFLSLLITSWLGDGLKIDGLTTWITAPILIWLLTVLFGFILPKFLFKKKKSKNKEDV